MWLSGQHKRPADQGEGQVGVITVGGGEAAALLDCERRGLQVYAPAGYHWTPEVGQRVLVVQGKGEIPCVAGVRQGGSCPGTVTVEAKSLSLEGTNVDVTAGGAAVVHGETVTLEGLVYVNQETLEQMITRIVLEILAGL